MFLVLPQVPVNPFHQPPYSFIPSFSADSELEKEQWLEAMQGAIAEALSTSEVAERIWAAVPNKFCADCGAAQPDWASINLCIVICKRCAGTCALGAPGRAEGQLACVTGGEPLFMRLLVCTELFLCHHPSL